MQAAVNNNTAPCNSPLSQPVCTNCSCRPSRGMYDTGGQSGQLQGLGHYITCHVTPRNVSHCLGAADRPYPHMTSFHVLQEKQASADTLSFELDSVNVC